MDVVHTGMDLGLYMGIGSWPLLKLSCRIYVLSFSRNVDSSSRGDDVVVQAAAAYTMESSMVADSMEPRKQGPRRMVLGARRRFQASLMVGGALNFSSHKKPFGSS